MKYHNLKMTVGFLTFWFVMVLSFLIPLSVAIGIHRLTAFIAGVNSNQEYLRVAAENWILTSISILLITAAMICILAMLYKCINYYEQNKQ